jgi:hypothetical protein
MKTAKLATLVLLFAAISTPAPGRSASLGGPAAAGPRVQLRNAAVVQPDANGFFTLGEIAAVTGGDKGTRERLEAVPVGRVPFDYSRCINLGDVALKLREAGFDPDNGLVLTGSPTTLVSGAQTEIALPGSTTTAPSTFEGEGRGTTSAPSPSEGTGQGDVPAPGSTRQIVIHRGDPVTIVIQEDDLTVTAGGQSRGDGAIGDTILVHRPGVMTDLSVQVLDDHTVQMEL